MNAAQRKAIASAKRRGSERFNADRGHHAVGIGDYTAIVRKSPERATVRAMTKGGEAAIDQARRTFGL